MDKMERNGNRLSDSIHRYLVRKSRACKNLKKYAGGEGEIRTRGTLSSTSAFEAGAFNHSATSPRHLFPLPLSSRKPQI